MRITRITLKSFLVSLLGILTAEVGFSDDRKNEFHNNCYRGGKICYSFVSIGEPNWNTAHDKCQNKNLSLPIIRNREEQAALETYLRKLNSKYQNITAVWTSGKRNTWTWLNNQTLSRTAIIIYHDYSAEKTHMALYWWHTETGNILKPENPLSPAWYLCQYKDHQCNGQQHEVNATYGCLIPSAYGNASWYEARNECLSKGGDLPILTARDLHNLKNHRFPHYNYWIGLRRVPHWVWIISNINKALGEEMNYTNWAKEEMSTDDGKLCISIATNDSQWRASRCNHTMLSVVCEKRAQITTDSISRKSTTATTISNHNGGSSLTAYAAIGAGVVVIVILCIVVVVVVICRKSKSSNNKTEPEQTDSGNTNETKDKNTKENPSKPTEEQSIYADIPLAERNANDAPEAGQKGLVYASLDFNQGATYEEPSKLYAVTKNIQDVSGPIYAEPLNGTGNGATSVGSSPAVKIGPMGDVYTLPTTNVTPSSDKTTERPIYANT